MYGSVFCGILLLFGVLSAAAFAVVTHAAVSAAAVVFMFKHVNDRRNDTYNDYRQEYYTCCVHNRHILSHKSDERADSVNGERHEPGDPALDQNNTYCPSFSEFTPYGCNSGNARGIKQS